MRSDHDHVHLTKRELSALAELEKVLREDDPNLSRQLDSQASAPAWRGWVGALLVALGAVTVLAAFTFSLWLAIAGTVVMAVGFGLAAVHLAAAAAQRPGRARGG